MSDEKVIPFKAPATSPGMRDLLGEAMASVEHLDLLGFALVAVGTDENGVLEELHTLRTMTNEPVSSVILLLGAIETAKMDLHGLLGVEDTSE